MGLCGFKDKGLKVNIGKTKVMRSSVNAGVERESGKYPCSICLKGVGSNAVQCGSCKKWVHKKCSGVKGKLKADSNFHCTKCMHPGSAVTSRTGTLELEQGVSVECVD